MKKQEFKKILNALSTDGRMDLTKVAALTQDEKKAITSYLVRNMEPAIVNELIPDDPEYKSWLACMGYMYYHKHHGGYTFNCTSLGKIRLETSDKQYEKGTHTESTVTRNADYGTVLRERREVSHRLVVRRSRNRRS